MAEIIELGSRSFARRAHDTKRVERTEERAVFRGLLGTLLLLVSIGASVAIVDRTFGVLAGTVTTTAQFD